jgi:hypothetical protein
MTNAIQKYKLINPFVKFILVSFSGTMRKGCGGNEWGGKKSRYSGKESARGF